MEQNAMDQGDHAPVHHKNRHIAEKLESWVVIAMGVVGAVLLAVLVYFFMQTGNSNPPWMHYS
jgi:hypothetical protein